MAARLSEFFTKKPNLIFFYLGGELELVIFFHEESKSIFVCVCGGGGGGGGDGLGVGRDSWMSSRTGLN